jgi:hypothetical protein
MIDAFLVCIRSENVGFIDRRGHWKSKTVNLISASGGKDGSQEHLLLVRNGSWIQTEQGIWQWQIRFTATGRPQVELAPVEAEAAEIAR